MSKIYDRIKTFKKGLFVYSDPGGAKPILAFVSNLKSKNGTIECTVVSDRIYDFSNTFSPVEIVDDIDQWLIRNNDFDFIFTGTSYTSEIEKKAIKWSAARDLQSFSFVDHWTNISTRFLYLNEFCFPDTILVIDDKAKEIGVAEGIEKSRLLVIRNPYHEYLMEWKPSIDKTDFYSALNIKEGETKLITFAPDPVSNLNWKDKHGVDESDVLTQLLDVLLKCSHEQLLLLIQVHPNQNKSLFEDIIIRDKYTDLNIRLGLTKDTPTLLYHSDIVIGMFSNILQEAELFGTSIIRFLPLQLPDLMKKELGIVVRDASTCQNAISEFL